MIRTCAKYEELFVDMMLVDELGIEPPGDDNPWKDGAITFTSFCFFGFFPLAAYCVFGALELAPPHVAEDRAARRLPATAGEAGGPAL